MRRVRIKRGDICIAQLPDPVGSEQGGTRPVLIVQNNIGNCYSPVVIVAAITGRKKPAMPTHVEQYKEICTYCGVKPGFDYFVLSTV